MLVDPNTGLPIGNDMPVNANTVGGQISMDMASGLGYSQEDIPLFYDVASSMPSVASTMGWNVSRVQGTIFRGGRRGAASARGIRQTLSPMSWRRLANPVNIDPTNSGISKAYSPFNFLSDFGNKGARLISNRSESLAAKMAAYNGAEGNLFSPGTVGRIAAVGKMNTMGGKALGKAANNVYSSINAMNPTYYANTFQPKMNLAVGLRAPEGATTAAMRGGMTATVTGGVSGRVAGFVGMVETPADEAARAAFKMMLPEGSAARAGAVAGEKLMAKYGGTMVGRALGKGAISGAARAAGPVGWILLAHDLAMMGGKLVGTGINTAIDAGRSIKGSIDKPVFGMGYRDNSVAATSRQRGVMAISNSRLNMRSALGSEAAMMHAHFG
jgi:hypothetical protein